MTAFDPSQPSAAVLEMRAKARVCRDLLGGTPGMRGCGKAYLPQWPQEQTKAWEARRDSTTLFPAFEKAIETMVGKPFDCPIVLDGVPSVIEQAAENIDNAGRDLDTFARDTFGEILADGIGWLLVDHPPMLETPTLKQYQESGARPYWVFLPLSRMLGWKTRIVNGKQTVVQVRFLESVETDGEHFYETKEATRVKVWEPGLVTIYVKPADQWVIESATPVSIQEIPIVALYTGRKGFWSAKPPLENLAWLNVTHWQSSSDQRNILHVSRVPFLDAEEDRREDTSAQVAIGPSGILTGFVGLKWNEIQGGSTGAGEQDIDRLEDQMRRVAGELLASKVEKTARETTQESREGASWLKARVWTFQDALEEALRLSALWLGEAQGGSATVSTDWDEEELAADMIQALTSAQTSGTLSRRSVLWNFKRRGLIPPDRTVEQEMADIEAEGPVGMTGPEVVP